MQLKVDFEDLHHVIDGRSHSHSTPIAQIGEELGGLDFRYFYQESENTEFWYDAKYFSYLVNIE